MADHPMQSLDAEPTVIIPEAALTQILKQLESLRVSQQLLTAKVDALTSPVRAVAAAVSVPARASSPSVTVNGSYSVSTNPASPIATPSSFGLSPSSSLLQRPPAIPTTQQDREKPVAANSVFYWGMGLPEMTHRTRHSLDKFFPTGKRSHFSAPRTRFTPGAPYPDQTGIRPVPLQWGAQDPKQRGPVVPSRLPASIKLRNAIGAHSGSYSIYRALSIALGKLSPSHKPSYRHTEPPVSIPPQPAWFDARQIVSLDPWGHLVPQIWAEQIEAGLDVRPSIAITKAHIKLSEIDEAARKGHIKIDGTLVMKSRPILNADYTESNQDPGVELACSKAAIEPVWYLPGVADRFKISEGLLRRALFEDTGGMYPELITRPDIKVFLPPIGGLTVYIFGKPEYLSDTSKELTLRVHDECNGSDVFGSDICTCKPYLIFAIEECIRCVQRGGVGIVVYFRKEGRALGEVTKYLVYNLRKREGDSADKYFKSTEMIAGVKDSRFQALMPDVLHWLGIRKIDNMVSMSDMKYDAIVQSGIPILKRYDIPDHLIPPDSRVEIDAKIAAGYFTSGKVITQEDLTKTVGRAWEETEH